MNHSFTQSVLNQNSEFCARCKRTEIDHTEQATCEACPNIGPCELVNNVLMCEECQSKNKSSCDTCGALFDSTPKSKFGDKLLCGNCIGQEYQKAIAATKEHEALVRYNTDFYNASTRSICEVKEAIEANTVFTADEKRFELHKFVLERYQRFSEALAKENPAINPNNLTDLVITFRAEIREKIKASDINYQPTTKAPKVAKPKLGKSKPKTIQEKMAQLLVASAAKSGKVITMEQALAKINSDIDGI